jgi:hypothetical protein
MNLQEDINRIKEVMGINEASMNPYLLRRIPEFVRAIIDIAEAIYVRGDREYSDIDFRNFLDRAIFGSVRDVIGAYDLTHDELKKLEIILSRIINDDRDLLQTLKQIYISKLDLMGEGINESTTYLKRRLPELIDAVIQAADWYMPSFMPDFQTYLDRAIYSGIISVVPMDYADTHVREMEELEDGLRNFINSDKKLLEKFVTLYTRGAKKYVAW